MSQTIRRKGAPVRKVAAQQKTARKVRDARVKTGSALDAAMSWVPLDEDQLHKAFLIIILAAAMAAAVIVARIAGVPELLGQQFALAASQAGFAVEKVEVRGVKHLNELKVYERVQGDIGVPMPQLDVDRIRAELVQLSWVEDARVSRQLPDRLVIDIVERSPHAVLRKPDRLVLIDAQGNELEPVSPEAAAGKLIVSGPGAGRQVSALSTLLDAAPALKPQVAEAEWVGNRRWNIAFKTGQVLALPEGAKQSAGALMSFARLDGTNRLLGGRVTAFDMRAPDRIYFRIPDRATDAAKADLAKKLREAQASQLATAGSTPQPTEAKAAPPPVAPERKPAEKAPPVKAMQGNASAGTLASAKFAAAKLALARQDAVKLASTKPAATKPAAAKPAKAKADSAKPAAKAKLDAKSAHAKADPKPAAKSSHAKAEAKPAAKTSAHAKAETKPAAKSASHAKSREKQ